MSSPCCCQILRRPAGDSGQDAHADRPPSRPARHVAATPRLCDAGSARLRKETLATAQRPTGGCTLHPSDHPCVIRCIRHARGALQTQHLAATASAARSSRQGLDGRRVLSPETIRLAIRRPALCASNCTTRPQPLWMCVARDPSTPAWPKLTGKGWVPRFRMSACGAAWPSPTRTPGRQDDPRSGGPAGSGGGPDPKAWL